MKAYHKIILIFFISFKAFKVEKKLFCSWIQRKGFYTKNVMLIPYSISPDDDNGWLNAILSENVRNVLIPSEGSCSGAANSQYFSG